MSKKRVICYIDGFNLYHSIDDLKPKQNHLKWVNLFSLSEAFIKKTTEEIINVYYFTAYAYWLPNAEKRHRAYVDAISYFGVTPIFGHFKDKPARCNACGAVWKTHEEKQSDVNLATYLIHHAHLDLYDKALIISADSDLCSVTQLVMDTFPNKEICVLVPPNRYNITNEIRSVVSSQKIKLSHLKNNLMPFSIQKPDGSVVALAPVQYQIL